eukprot:5108541-Pyramimonas_sp.AAC.1
MAPERKHYPSGATKKRKGRPMPRTVRGHAAACKSNEISSIWGHQDHGGGETHFSIEDKSSSKAPRT